MCSRACHGSGNHPLVELLGCEDAQFHGGFFERAISGMSFLAILAALS